MVVATSSPTMVLSFEILAYTLKIRPSISLTAKITKQFGSPFSVWHRIAFAWPLSLLLQSQTNPCAPFLATLLYPIHGLATTRPINPALGTFDKTGACFWLHRAGQDKYDL